MNALQQSKNTCSINSDLSVFASAHLEDFFDLTAIWSEGVNFSSRLNGGVSPTLTNFLRSPKTLGFISIVEAALGLKVVERDAPTKNSRLYKTIKSPLICASRGKGGKTIAHKTICLYAASMHNPLFFVDVCNKLTDIENIISAINDFEVDEDLIRDHDLYVYAIRNEETKKIKIGITKDPEGRLSTLQSANHAELTLAAIKKVSSKSEEKEFHKINLPYHIRGEWFECRATID